MSNWPEENNINSDYVQIQSIFMLDLQQISLLQQFSTRRSLIVIDKFGKGTDVNGFGHMEVRMDKEIANAKEQVTSLYNQAAAIRASEHRMDSSICAAMNGVDEAIVTTNLCHYQPEDKISSQLEWIARRFLKMDLSTNMGRHFTQDLADLLTTGAAASSRGLVDELLMLTRDCACLQNIITGEAGGVISDKFVHFV
ncbi:hypothetical protein TSTA_075560 [Talaromyces stipitatus ATCC 10500]|uniref:Uncharacterized protein n=1 Tax=Talaromyces stipitatus (strain ATCC 10500 / CBS 375.48 / QM 6759 / NRRL 1006) TaxID=441959 RepID=B8LVQ4_TALSN|nr:uncharacterized protein TSTA_075560 [Talaromyces stipitatus ATCC 10500]EED24184.1 hypothetical protein TSTA_075560 [Talaromyces stipitatus ATCC 10500]